METDDEEWYVYTKESQTQKVPKHVVRVKVDASVKKVRVSAFKDRKKMEQVEFSEGLLELIGTEAFLRCKSLLSVCLPSTTRVIGWSSFSGCSKLKNVTFNEGLEEIPTAAFFGCGLELISLPSTIRIIGKLAFAECNHLKKVGLNDGLLHIRDRAFKDCPKLKEVRVPSSVESQGNLAFDVTVRKWQGDSTSDKTHRMTPAAASAVGYHSQAAAGIPLPPQATVIEIPDEDINTGGLLSRSISPKQRSITKHVALQYMGGTQEVPRHLLNEKSTFSSRSKKQQSTTEHNNNTALQYRGGTQEVPRHLSSKKSALTTEENNKKARDEDDLKRRIEKTIDKNKKAHDDLKRSSDLSTSLDLQNASGLRGKLDLRLKQASLRTKITRTALNHDKDIKSLQAQLSQVGNRIRIAKDALSERDEEIKSLRDTVISRDEEIRELRKQNAALQQSLESLKKQQLDVASMSKAAAVNNNGEHRVTKRPRIESHLDVSSDGEKLVTREKMNHLKDKIGDLIDSVFEERHGCTI